MKNIQKNAFGHIDVLARTNDCSILNIKHNAVQATVSLYGGQVLSWQPTGEREVFWLSQASEYSSGKAIRGGVPICWPWFGAYKDGGNHGFARQSI